MRGKVALPLLFFALCGLPVLHANPGVRLPVVMVLLRSSQGMETPSLRALIIDAITVELETHEAVTVSPDETARGSSEVFAIAEKEHADFAINGTYQLQGKDVELAVSWYDFGERKVFPEVKAAGLLDLSFDSVVSRLVDDLVDGHEQRLTSLPSLLEPETAPAGPDQASTARLAPAVEPIASPAPAPSVEKVLPVTLPARLPKPSPLSFSVGSAPFIPVMKASAYIPSVGLSFSAEGEYRFPFAGGLLGICGATGIDLFHAQKASAADAFALPIAGGIVYRTLTGSLVDFAVKAQAGPAIFVFSPSGSAGTVGIVAFLSTGLAATMNISALLGVSANLDYVAFLVPDAIMGFVPSVTLDLRL